MIITSLNNEKIKYLTKLNQKKYRSDTFLVEGKHLVEEAYKKNLVKLLITYNRIEPFLNILTLPYDFDSKEHKKELKEFNKKYKNEWWFEKPKK